MKRILLFFFISVALAASEYYSKAEPLHRYTIQANTSGLVVMADETVEGKKLTTKPFVLIDDSLNQQELAILKQKQENLKKSFELNKAISKNLQEIIDKKQKNYERIKTLPIKSTIEKDREFFDLANSQNQFLTTLEKIENIQMQLHDTNYRIAQLERMIADKRITAEGMILYKLHVKSSQVVAMGVSLAEVADVSKAKLTIFLDAKEIETVREKRIYLNDTITEYRIDKIWPLSDSEHISAYKTEIVINAPKQFSQLYKISFK